MFSAIQSKKRTVAMLVLNFMLVLVCSSSVLAENIYHHESACSDTAKDIKVETKKDGTATLTALSKTAIPVQISSSGSMLYCIDGLGSQNIQIAINKNVGYTQIPGLKFRQEAVINIWKDGIVEVDKEGIEVTGTNGIKLISKKVKINGNIATVLIKKM